MRIRGFLFRLVNKEFLIFLLFLAVSTAFWFLSTLNEIYEKELPVTLKLTEVPENVIVTERLPDTIRVTVRDKGFNLFNYMLKGEIPLVALPFRLYARSNGKGQITQNELLKIVGSMLSETATITAVKADHLDFYYNYGMKKRVPVMLDGSIQPKTNFYVTQSMMTPDSVFVYATRDALDTINDVHTQHVQMENVYEASTSTVGLQHIHGAKITPESVKLSIITDQLTEVVISVPVKTENVPENVSLKTFPARVEVRVAVGVKRSAYIKPELFTIIADYNDMSSSEPGKLPLKLQNHPKGIVRAQLAQKTVDYLVER